MGSLRLTLCAGSVVAVALAPTAYAVDAQGVFLTPASPMPGTDVRLAVRGCAGTTGSAVSDAFVAEARLVGRDGMLTGDTRVRSALPPGRYSVTVGCDGRQVKGVLTVGGPSVSPPRAQTAPASPGIPASAAVPAAPTAPATRSAPVRPSAPSSPVAPVPAGGGGTAPLSAADARAAGPGTRQAVVGLVLASVAAIVVVARSVRRGRGRE
ncbi:hypothetical protein [Streptomyces sp. TP-A0356]|uniref:hypothetical protein n=1 Tax=Streptomyces sp. TP-A0356 TaxID=1359208 RepID=UPI0006E14B48|nr:hypothetical protein [Streptomyces sp. TP-A0356]